MNTSISYSELIKPTWAPPSYLFGPVWTVLYVLIAISFGGAVKLFLGKHIPFVVLLPFILNIVFNLLFTWIQFGLKNLPLAALDILSRLRYYHLAHDCHISVCQMDHLDASAIPAVGTLCDHTPAHDYVLEL